MLPDGPGLQQHHDPLLCCAVCRWLLLQQLGEGACHSSAQAAGLESTLIFLLLRPGHQPIQRARHGGHGPMPTPQDDCHSLLGHLHAPMRLHYPQPDHRSRLG